MLPGDHEQPTRLQDNQIQLLSSVRPAPKSHFRFTQRNLALRAERCPTTEPDCLLLRDVILWSELTDRGRRNVFDNIMIFKANCIEAVFLCGLLLLHKP